MPLHASIEHWETFRLRDLIEEICGSLAPRLAEHAIKAQIDIPFDLTVVADRDLLGRAVRNLVFNALAAMPRGGSLVATSAVGPHAIELEVADSGSPLSDDERHRVFEPLANVRCGGSGWGLAVVHRIAKLHGGSIVAANCPDGGVAFTLRIPRPVAREAVA
jgi:signal transduction histidine kinase